MVDLMREKIQVHRNNPKPLSKEAKIRRKRIHADIIVTPRAMARANTEKTKTFC